MNGLGMRVIRPAVLCCAVDAPLLRGWCRRSLVHSRLRHSEIGAPNPEPIQVRIHSRAGCSRLVERGSPNRDLIPRRAFSSRRGSGNKSGNKLPLRGIYLPMMTWLALMRPVPVFATITAGFDPATI